MAIDENNTTIFPYAQRNPLNPRMQFIKKNPGVIPGFDISVATFRNFVDFEDLIGEDATLIVQPKKRKRHSSWRKKPARLVKAV